MPYRCFIVVDSNVLRNKLGVLIEKLSSLDRVFRYGLEKACSNSYTVNGRR